MPEVNITDWNHFLESHPEAHLLQLGEWGELKRGFGWKPVRLIQNEVGAQILFRRLPLGLTIGYLPKPVMGNKLQETSNEFWKEVDSVCKQNKAIFLKIEPDTWSEEFILHAKRSSFILGVRSHRLHLCHPDWESRHGSDDLPRFAEDGRAG